MKILIVLANFYQNISDLLFDGATKRLQKCGYQYNFITVPGALEIPTAIAIAEKHKIYSGYVALGCVIRGETSHYDIVCNQSAYGLTKLALKHQLAIGNGILTTENEEQAIVRADPKQLNKGAMAVDACISLIKFKQNFS